MILRKRGPLVGLAVVALAASACSAAATPTAAPATPTAPAIPTEYVDQVIPGMGAGLKIGYISGGDSIPFVKTVSDGIKAQADIAGVDLTMCDSALKADEALKCAQNFKLLDLKAVINWQFFADSAEAVCEAYGNLPTVSIDVHERPCEKTFTGINNTKAGEVLGTGMGNFVKSKFNCEYDQFVSIEAVGIKEISDLRMGSTKEAFAEVCGEIPADKLTILSNDAIAGPPEENMRKSFGDFLTTHPNDKVIIVVALSDPSLIGLFAAVKAAGRTDDVWAGSHGGDTPDEIRTNEHWVGDAAYTPEFYGKMIIPVAVALAKGYETPPEVLLTATWIDRSNVDQFYPASASPSP